MRPTYPCTPTTTSSEPRGRPGDPALERAGVVWRPDPDTASLGGEALPGDGGEAEDCGLVGLGVALTEVGVIPLSATAAEVAAARERSAIQVTHTGRVWSLPNGITELGAAGLIGPDLVHVHCNTLTEDEWRVLARNDVKVSISVETELNLQAVGRQRGDQPVRRGLRTGVDHCPTSNAAEAIGLGDRIGSLTPPASRPT